MCADAARAHKRVDTCGFHPLVYLPFPLEGLAQTRGRRPLRNGGTAVGLPLRVFREIFAVHRQRTATHTVKSTQARHTRVAQLVSLEIMDGTYESIYLAAFILVGAVYHNALTSCAALLCRACLDEITCVAVIYLTLRICLDMGAHCAPLR